MPIIKADFSHKKKITPASFFALDGYNYSVPLDKWHISDMAADYVFVGDHELDFEVPGTLGVINYKRWKTHKKGYPCFKVNEYLEELDKSEKMNMIYADYSDLSTSLFDKLKNDTTAVLLLDSHNKNTIAELRRFIIKLINNNIKTPVIVGKGYENLSEQQLQISASSDLGSLLLDGLGDGIFIYAPTCSSDQKINSLGFGILQATRTRISKTEYISCPSCGRTFLTCKKQLQKSEK